MRLTTNLPGRLAALGLGVTLVFPAAGCVRRTMTITTEPPNALVFVNDQEVGRSEVTTDFLWYGDYDIVIRKEGYKTLVTHWKVKPPWYERIPFDFFFEVLWPGHLHDKHAQNFTLEVQELPTPQDLADRAVGVREQAMSVEEP
ncbi:MAG: PEGA domain-containing protein [Planctomycetes bacterium]|nr:PEGA domain-containing protein [Planctomycetota bacterium]